MHLSGSFVLFFDCSYVGKQYIWIVIFSLKRSTLISAHPNCVRHTHILQPSLTFVGKKSRESRWQREESIKLLVNDLFCLQPLCGKRWEKESRQKEKERDGREWDRGREKKEDAVNRCGEGERTKRGSGKWLDKDNPWGCLCSICVCVCVMSMVGWWTAHIESLKQRRDNSLAVKGEEREESRYGHNNTYICRQVHAHIDLHTHPPSESVSWNCHSERRFQWVPSCVPVD